MRRYVCQHDRRDLGEVIEDAPVPACPDHPEGVIEVVIEEDADGARLDP